MTYTVLDNQGNVIARHLSAQDAMVEILTDDGHGYEIRKAEDGNGFELWVTQFSRNSTLGGKPMVKSAIWSFEADESKATDEIAAKVIAADWRHKPEAITDEQYDEMKAAADFE